jgi:hypothetical protein
VVGLVDDDEGGRRGQVDGAGAEGLGGAEVDGDVGVGGRLPPHRAQRGGGDDEGAVARVRVRLAQQGEGDPRLAEADRVGEQRTAVAVEAPAEAGARDDLVRAERVRTHPQVGEPGAVGLEVEGGGGESGANAVDVHRPPVRRRAAQAGSRMRRSAAGRRQVRSDRGRGGRPPWGDGGRGVSGPGCGRGARAGAGGGRGAGGAHQR